MRLRFDPDPILRQACAELVEADLVWLPAFVEGMLDVMYSNDGCGLAAPQVGRASRLIIVDPSAGDDAKACRVMVNPEAVNVSSLRSPSTEGCLSLPGEAYVVDRPLRVSARWRNLDWSVSQAILDEASTRVFLHELDHLAGVLIKDVGSRATLSL